LMTISVDTRALEDNVLLNQRAEIYSTVRWDYDAGDRVYAFRLGMRKPDGTLLWVSFTDLTPYENGNVYTDHTTVTLDQLGTWKFMGDCKEWTVDGYWHNSPIINLNCIQSDIPIPEPIPQEPQQGSLGGLVYSVDGVMLSGAYITATPAGGGAKAGASTRTDDSGYFSMNLGEGIYDVKCSMSGYITQTLQCAVHNQAASGPTWLNFIMFTSSYRFAYGFIGGFVKSQDGRFLPGASVSGMGVTDEFGWFGSDRKDVGTYAITASKAGYNSASANVTVTAGNLTKVNFTLTEASLPPAPPPAPPTPPAKATLTMMASTSGTTDPPAGSYQYDLGSSVMLKAYPNEGYVFDHWILTPGGFVRTENPTPLVMDGDVNVEPVFEASPAITPTPQVSKAGMGFGAFLVAIGLAGIAEAWRRHRKKREKR